MNGAINIPRGCSIAGTAHLVLCLDILHNRPVTTSYKEVSVSHGRGHHSLLFSTNDVSNKMGVQKTIIKPGSGRTPKQGELVQAHYVGRFLDGKEFDSSRARNKPLTFMIGIGSVIKGWDEGILDMKLGEIAILKVTSDFGYGPEGMPPTIPPNADLEFEVELLSAGDDKADSGGCVTM